MIIDYSIYQKDFPYKISVSTEYFGVVDVEYIIEKLTPTNKLLRYRFQGHSEIIEIDYSNIVRGNLKLDEYFKNCILLIYKQVVDYKKDVKFRSMVNEDEFSKRLITFFEKMYDDFHTGTI